jgi:hypothetical protein
MLHGNIAKQKTVSKNRRVYHFVIVLLMLMSAVLGSTIFDTAQIGVEIVLFLLLGYGILKVKLRLWDIILLFVFLLVFAISFFLNDFIPIALNFKIYGLCILTYIYFSKVQYYPRMLLRAVYGINIFLIIHQYITGHFIIASAWFFGQYQEYANTRPVGIFLTPHGTSFFLAVYTLYLVIAKRKYLLGFFYFVLNVMTGSLTGLVAFMAQLSLFFFNYIAKSIPFLKIKLGLFSKFLIIGLPLLLLAIFKEEFVDLLRDNPYSRSFSIEIILNQLFDSRFFSDIFKVYPRDYQAYTIGQETLFADFANEIGFVKVLVEAGFVLGVLLLITLIKNIKYYGIFIFVSLLHYSFAINMPFMLFLILQYNNEMIGKQSQSHKNLG